MASIDDNPVSWDDHVARMVDHIDSDELPARLVAGLSALNSFSMATIFILRGQSRPICTFENFPESVNKIGIENFVGGTYVLNPVYRAHLNGIEQGVHVPRSLTDTCQLLPVSVRTGVSIYTGSIALNLDISVTTIKTHRKRAYSKLNISSQSELFSMFLNCAKASFS